MVGIKFLSTGMKGINSSQTGDSDKWGFSPIRLPTQGITYLLGTFRKIITVNYLHWKS
jgi:hypothetical protein